MIQVPNGEGDRLPAIGESGATVWCWATICARSTRDNAIAAFRIN